jgi:methionine-rich copper-binding protein CopC
MANIDKSFSTVIIPFSEDVVAENITAKLRENAHKIADDLVKELMKDLDVKATLTKELDSGDWVITHHITKKAKHD